MSRGERVFGWIAQRAPLWLALTLIDFVVAVLRSTQSSVSLSKLFAVSLGGTIGLGIFACAVIALTTSAATASARWARLASTLIGAVYGFTAGVGFFSGAGLFRAKLAVPLIVIATIAGALAPFVIRRIVSLNGSKWRIAACVFGAVILAVHLGVLVRQYALAHAVMAFTAVGVLSEALALRGRSRRFSLWLSVGAITAVLVSVAMNAGSTLVRAGAVSALSLGGYLSRAVGVAAVRLAARRPVRAMTVGGWGRGPHWPFAGRDVVLVTVDALRADRLTAMGGHGRMPSLDALARAGVLFRRAYTATPHTSYALASIMLGTHARAVLSLERQGPKRRPLADFLTARGYSTAGFLPPAVFSVDAERFGALATTRFGFGYRAEDWSSATDRVDAAVRWVGAQSVNTRVFVWVHLFEPHEPYESHSEFVFGPRQIDRYDAECAVVDRAIARLREGISHLGRAPIYVITADHGEEFGEHGGAYHGTSLFDEQVRVPLVFVGQGIAPAVIDYPVSLIDVAPTVLAGMGATRPPRVRGSDLAPIAARAVTPPPVFAGTGTLRMVVSGRFKLIADVSDGTSSLYDLESDPREERNLVEVDPSTANRLRNYVAEWEAGHALVDAEGDPAVPVIPSALARAEQGDRSAAPEVAVLLRHGSRELRPRCARVLGDLGDASPEIRAALVHALEDDVPSVRREAAVSLGLLHDPRGVSLARLSLRDESVSGRWRAALSLVRARDVSGVEPLIALVREFLPGDQRRADGVRALRTLDPSNAVPLWLDLIDDPWVGPDAVMALSPHADAAIIARLRNALSTTRYPVTARAILTVLADARAPDVLSAIVAQSGRGDPLPGLFSLLDKVGPRARRVESLRTPQSVTPHRVRTITLDFTAVSRAPRRLYLFVTVAGSADGTLTINAQSVAVHPGSQSLVIDAAVPFSRSLRVVSDVPLRIERVLATRRS